MKAAASHDLAMPPEAYDWVSIGRSLDAHGNAVLPGLLTAEQCDDLALLYPQEEGYRTRIVMARHGFGRGEYKYFAYPLPPLLDRLRHALYRWLAPVANRWNLRLGVDVQYPDDLAAFLQRCHEAGQTRPTPLILQYGEGDYNCLHQDLYGEHVFPLQVAILLSEPGKDFAGGEFVMTELSTRGQRADVVALRKGDAVVFTVNQRPAMGWRGTRKVAMRHGVSRIRSGKRHTVGLIFHDSR
ncbi:oxygenase, catalysing oxidative methylation of damaged DNA family protein [Burkholderia pseudomallei]|uniref:Oxygenase, catalysing oxidative methylation of damaged DNA family protein n=2 Tax=Burkholderia pseudomallei TaxID=28450 RepID=A0AA40JE88_BURPE|nr:oxygenase, catalysing oxidative methylation of damaged DNA family protein [Burkholderia pseudomallei]